MAKLADVYVPLLGSADNRFGRGETFIVVAILYVIGYVRALYARGCRRLMSSW